MEKIIMRFSQIVHKLEKRGVENYKRVFILGLFLSASVLFAQVPDTLWTRIYGGIGWDMAYSVQQTLDSGYIIAGETSSFGAGGSDVYLIKTNAAGDTLWTKTFGGIFYEYGYSVQQTLDSGYIVAGITGSYGAGLGDVYLIKTDAYGDTLWTKTYGGTEDDGAFSVQQTSDSGYIIAGCTYSFGAGAIDVYLIKTDAYGDTLWTKTYGGTEYDYGASVHQTPDSGYIIGGFADSDIYVIKTDAYGDTLWTKTYGWIADGEIGYSMHQNVDNSYVIVGVTHPYGSGPGDVYLIKIDANGDYLWEKRYGGTSHDVGYSVHQTVDNGYIIVGSTESFGSGQGDVYLIKTNAYGDTLWTKTYGGIDPDCGRFVQQTTDNGYIIAGWTFSFGPGGFDVWLLKLEPDISIEEKTHNSFKYFFGTTIINGPLRIPKGKNCKVYDISGRAVDINRIKPGIYFIEVEGKIRQKVVKIR